MKEVVNRILSLLKSAGHSPEDLRLKLNIASEHVKCLLEWGRANKLWLEDPVTNLFMLSDVGENFLNAPANIDDLIKLHPIELPEIKGEEANPLLKDEKLLCAIRAVMDKEIVGECENKLLLFLIFLSKDLGPEHAQACFIIGESSSGKSYMMHKVLSYFPDECIVWLTRSTAHGLEYLCKGMDLSGSILAVEEAPGVEHAQQYIRPIFSERGLRIVTATALGGGKVVSEIIEVKGCPAFVTTSCSGIIDDQMATRVWILSTDESEEQTKKILGFEARRGKYARKENVEEEKDIIRNALKQLKPVQVLVPYADFIDFPSNKVRARRDFPKLLTLIKISAYLHQYQRVRAVLNGQEYVIATFADYHIAYTLAKKVLRSTILGLAEGVLRVYDVCKKLGEEKITSRVVTENCDYSQSTVQKYLNQLVSARLLLRDESQKEYTYKLIKDSGLSLNQAIDERFGEEEFKDWLNSMTELKMSYEEIKGNIYDPLSPINESIMPKSINESGFHSEKANDRAIQQHPSSMIKTVEQTFRDLSKKFNGLIPLLDAMKGLKANGFDNPVEIIRKLFHEGKISEPQNGFLSILF